MKDEKQSECFVNKASDINFEEIFTYESGAPFYEVMTLLEDKYGEENFIIGFCKVTHNIHVLVYDDYLE